MFYLLNGTTTPIYTLFPYSSFHFLFHYPYITPIVYPIFYLLKGDYIFTKLSGRLSSNVPLLVFDGRQERSAAGVVVITYVALLLVIELRKLQ